MPEVEEKAKVKTGFSHLITIEPLGLLYGSAGAFLSPENLVGRSGEHFPPSATTLSGIYAAFYKGNKELLKDQQFAGPFWAKSTDPQNFYVPLPMNYLVKDGKIKHQMVWHQEQSGGIWLTWDREGKKWTLPPADKFTKGAWICISDWKKLQNAQDKNTQDFESIEILFTGDRWKFVPHLHPYLKPDERHVDEDRDRGSLFLENGVQMNPDFCLVYLSNTAIDDGWYRFGGEGHMVDLNCHDLGKTSTNLLNQDVGKSFAIITQAIWGSNRLSYREPRNLVKKAPKRHELEVTDSDLHEIWTVNAMLTERPSPFRYRLGGGEGKEKRLSRGRYAVPAGSVYVLKEPLPAWQDWDTDWFPQESHSYKRWGCGLALPLKGAIAPKN
jgi:CRISPR-associated protein Cmr3